MATTVVQLTRLPQLISEKAAFLDGVDNEFNYAFSPSVPTDLTVFHTARKLWTDGTLGGVYAWTTAIPTVRLIVSEVV